MTRTITRLSAVLAVCMFVAALATEIASRLFDGNEFALLIIVFASTAIAAAVGSTVSSRNRQQRRTRRRRTRRTRSRNTQSADNRSGAQTRDSRAQKSGQSSRRKRRGSQADTNERTNKDQASSAQRNRSRQSRLSGTIKSYSRRQLYGFITKDEGGDVFFHKSCLASERDANQIKSGAKVSFVTKQDHKGQYADDILFSDGS